MSKRSIQSLFRRVVDVLPANSPPPVQAGDRDAVTATLVYMIYFVMVALMGLCLYVVFRFLMPRQPEPIGECDEARANQCREGEVCERGRCVTEEAPLCAEGASCDGCLCPYPSMCQNGTCTKPTPGEGRCDSDTADLVTQLLEFEETCKKRAGGAPFSSCEAKDLNRFLLNEEKFESLLKDLPHGVITLFPDKKPELTETGEVDTSSAARWPDEVTKQGYIDGWKEQADALRSAKYIFLIGRAGTVVTNVNASYAKVRVSFTKERILDGIAKDSLERADLAKKFVEFAIGGEKPMGLDFFATYKYPLVTWNGESRRDLSTAIQKAKNNSKISPGLRRDVEAMINRSVIAFAVPTDCVRGK